MANKKISQLTAGAPAQETDLLPIDRSGANLSLQVSDILDLALTVISIPTAGTASPTPAFSPSESPLDINPAFFVQDINGYWHDQAGMDITTPTDPTGAAGHPTVPQGILTWDRIMFFRDYPAATQGGNNAFLSINHEACTGTSYNNQDRALWISMFNNVSGVTQQFSITSNVVTLILNVTNTFTPNQRVKLTGMSVATYLNSVALTIQTVSAISGGKQTLTLSDSAFTHADVSLTFDTTGVLNQVMYAMENLQMEQDVLGTPTFVSAVDGELSTLSVQMSDQHVGNGITAPELGIQGIRAEYFREIGSGTWASSPIPCAIKTITQDNASTGDAAQGVGGIVVLCNTATTTCPDSYAGVTIVQPSNRMLGGNIGLFVGAFSTNTLDFAIYSPYACQSLLAGPVGVGSLFPALNSSTTAGLIAVSGGVSSYGFKTSKLSTPGSPYSLQAIGTTGSTTYSYVLVALDPNGNGVASATSTITNGNATLNGSNYNFMELTGSTFPLGASSVAVYRTVGGATQGKIGSFTLTVLNSAQFANTNFSDQGAVGDSTTPPTVNDTGSIVAAGPLSAGQYAYSGLPDGKEGQMVYCTNGRKIGEGGGSGTGVPVYYSAGGPAGAGWYVFSSAALVTA